MKIKYNIEILRHIITVLAKITVIRFGRTLKEDAKII